MTRCYARLCTSLLFAASLYADSSPLNLRWADLSPAITGKSVTVDMKDGSSMKAKVTSVEPAALAVEGAVVAATTGLAIAAATTDVQRGRRWLAAGWAAHALFDFGQGPSEDSRLPGWYAPVCAGFDFAYAARLAR